VEESEVNQVEQRVKAMNRLARLHRTRQAELPVNEVLNLHAFDLEKKLEVDADFLKPEMPFEWSGVYTLEPGVYDLVFQPGPDPVMGFVILPVHDIRDETLSVARKQAVFLFSSTDKAVRADGEIKPAEVFYKLVLNDDTTTFRIPIRQAGSFVVFTQHLPAEFELKLKAGCNTLQPTHGEEHAAGHTHDDTVTSVGISCAGELDQKRLNDWLGETLRTKGADIFRMKGILNVKGSANRFVFQGVHMLFDGKPDRPWEPDEERLNQLVFIGRKLNREALNAGFKRCLVS
jgi:G3E family GTPase